MLHLQNKSPEADSMSVQTSLKIGQPGDKYEQEADQMADQVMTIPQTQPMIQQKCARCDEEDLQMSPFPVSSESIAQMQTLEEEEEEEMLQPKRNSSSQPMVTDLSSQLSNHNMGSTLAGETNNFMSNAFGKDFSKVKIYTDSNAIQMNEELGAKAFTYKDNIFFNRGQYDPSGDQGKHLLAHELTHVVQQSGTDIQRAPMPAEADVSSLTDYTPGTRQRIRYDTGYDLQSVVSTYFQPGIVMDVVDGYNVTYVVRGFAADENWVTDPLKAMALYTFNLKRPETVEGEEEDREAPPAPIVNISMVQNLDLSGQTNPSDSSVNGPHATIRFTTTQFDATGPRDSRTQNVQLLIEKLGNYTPSATTETPEARSQRYSNTYQITNAIPETGDPLAPPNTMSDDQFDQVLQALNGVPDGLLSQVTGIPIYREIASRGPDGEAARYNQDRPAGSTAWTRKITVYNDFFGMTAEQRTFTMIHEIGHALDYRPNETAANRRGGAALSSGRGRGSFRQALQQDGGLSRGMSTYAATGTDYTEYYAEAFAMYISQPATLEALRPNVFRYFSTQFP